MSGAIPPLPQYALMAWCLVKTRGKLYLNLYEKRLVKLLASRIEFWRIFCISNSWRCRIKWIIPIVGIAVGLLTTFSSLHMPLIYCTKFTLLFSSSYVVWTQYLIGFSRHVVTSTTLSDPSNDSQAPPTSVTWRVFLTLPFTIVNCLASKSVAYSSNK
jgi:hypothetical protein